MSLRRPPLHILSLVACGLWLALGAAPARAQRAISIAVLPTGLKNPDHAELGEKLRAAMQMAVAEAPEFVESDAVAISIEELMTGLSCFEADVQCLAQIPGAGTAVQRLAWAELDRREGAWFLQVRMLDFKSRAYVFDREWTMPGGAERVEELVALAEGVIRGTAPAPVPTARLIVDSDPPGADISLDGRMLGTTPVTQQVTRGRHLVELSLPGRRTVKKEIDVGAGEARELIRLPIVPKVVPPTAAPVDPPASDWPLWAGIGAGAVAGGAAIVASVAYVQGNSAADEAEQAVAAADRARFDRAIDDHSGLKSLHLASVITAGVAGAAAIYFLAFHESDDSPTLTPTVSGDGAGAFISGSF